MKLEINAVTEIDALEREVSKSAFPRLISARDLYEGQIVTLRPLLKDLLWDGLTMLVARPKAGKSWLTLQAAVQVAGGREVPGIRALSTGPVLYAALEEPQARTMSRLRKIAPQGDWADNLQFIYDLLRLWVGAPNS